MNILGIIPARGGSKGIPGKNIRPLHGKPLIQYSIEAAQQSRLMDRLILTTDSPDIAEVGRSLGAEAPFIRPPELAQDNTPMLPVIEHAVLYLEQGGWRADIIILLQPTAPLRRAEHIQSAVKMLTELKCDSVVSVVQIPEHYSPDFAYKVDGGLLKPFLEGGGRATRRQDTRPAFSRDGTIYVFWRDTLMNKHNIYGEKCHPLILPNDQSCNLDTMEDWAGAERMISSQEQNP